MKKSKIILSLVLYLSVFSTSAALSATKVDLQISPDGIIPPLSLSCENDHNYTVSLVHSNGDSVQYSYGVVQRKLCVNGVLTFDSIDLNNLLTNNVDVNWWNWVHTPLEYIVKDSTGLYLPYCDENYCQLINLAGAFNFYDQSVYLASSTYWATTAYGPVFNTNDHQTWFNGSDLVLEQGHSNVLFLPGLEASRLYMDENGSENQLWEPNRNLDVEKLYLNSDGASINDVYTRDIIKETNTPIPSGFAGQNIYKTFSNTMDNLVSQGKINRWESYAYDWRQDINDILDSGTPYSSGNLSLIAVLQTLVETSKNGKVTIIAHSNGGLLAKALINKLQKENNPLLQNIDNLILVASPQIGTPSAIPAILHGYDQKILAGKIMTEWRARELGRNMLGAHGLLPSQEYFNKVSTSPVVFKDNDIPSGVTTNLVNNYGVSTDSYLEYKNFLFGNEGRENPVITDVINPIKLSSILFSRSESLHDDIDNWVPPQSLRIIEVAGWGLDTVASFEYYPKYSCSIPDSGIGKCGYVLDEKPIFTVDGDKTVVVPSAHYMSGEGNLVERYWIDLPEHNSELIFGRRNRQHKDILEVQQLNDLIISVLQKNSIIFDTVLRSTEPSYSGNKLRLAVHSPVNIEAYDSYGGFTGKVCPENSDFCYIKEEIPNSTYMEFGEGKYLNLDEENMQKIMLRGTDFGTFTFESEKVVLNEPSIISSFKDIPVNPETIGEVVFNTSTKQLELKLDEDGDGINDFTINPNNEFDPVQFLEVLKKNIESFDINSGQKQKLYSRIDDIMKDIEIEKVSKAEKKIEQFIKILENGSKNTTEDSEINKLSFDNIKMLVISLNKLLVNLK